MSRALTPETIYDIVASLLSRVKRLEQVLSKPRARIYNNGNISLSSGVDVVLTFNEERYNYHDVYSASSPSRLTAVESGTYVCGCSVSFASNATGRRQVQLRANGTNRIAVDERPPVNGAATRVVLSGVDFELEAGDYIEVVVLQSSGSPLNIEGSGTTSFSPEFWLRLT